MVEVAIGYAEIAEDSVLLRFYTQLGVSEDEEVIVVGDWFLALVYAEELAAPKSKQQAVSSVGSIDGDLGFAVSGYQFFIHGLDDED